MRTEILLVRFRTELSMIELPYFRGAIIGMVGTDHVLFHNHHGDGFRYSYPLVQYKRINGRAALLCIGDGAPEIGHLLVNMRSEITLAGRATMLEVDNIRGTRFNIQLWQTPMTYTIRRYLPFNQANYQAWRDMEGVVEKTMLLERCLTGNILSMCKSLGLRFDDTVTARVLSVERSQTITYKGVKMSAFDLVFTSNVSLPDFIGLGKGVSTGFGTVVKKKI